MNPPPLFLIYAVCLEKMILAKRDYTELWKEAKTIPR